VRTAPGSHAAVVGAALAVVPHPCCCSLAHSSARSWQMVERRARSLSRGDINAVTDTAAYACPRFHTNIQHAPSAEGARKAAAFRKKTTRIGHVPCRNPLLVPHLSPPQHARHRAARWRNGNLIPGRAPCNPSHVQTTHRPPPSLRLPPFPSKLPTSNVGSGGSSQPPALRLTSRNRVSATASISMHTFPPTETAGEKYGAAFDHCAPSAKASVDQSARFVPVSSCELNLIF